MARYTVLDVPNTFFELEGNFADPSHVVKQVYNNGLIYSMAKNGAPDGIERVFSITPVDGIGGVVARVDCLDLVGDVRILNPGVQLCGFYPIGYDTSPHSEVYRTLDFMRQELSSDALVPRIMLDIIADVTYRKPAGPRDSFNRYVGDLEIRVRPSVGLFVPFNKLWDDVSFTDHTAGYGDIVKPVFDIVHFCAKYLDRKGLLPSFPYFVSGLDNIRFNVMHNPDQIAPGEQVIMSNERPFIVHSLYSSIFQDPDFFERLVRMSDKYVEKLLLHPEVDTGILEEKFTIEGLMLYR